MATKFIFLCTWAYIYVFNKIYCFYILLFSIHQQFWEEVKGNKNLNIYKFKTNSERISDVKLFYLCHHCFQNFAVSDLHFLYIYVVDYKNDHTFYSFLCLQPFKSLNLYPPKLSWLCGNGKKTTSLTSGAGKTGQPLVKEWN